MSRIENVRSWRKTKRGLVTNLFSKMKTRKHVSFDLEFLHEFSRCTKFNRLFDEWVKSGYDKKLKPSVDRINNKHGYTEGNIQWISWNDNRFKQTMERRKRKGPVLQIKDGHVINRFESQRIAVKKTGLRQGNMSAVLNGKRNAVGGFSFVYEQNPELS